MSHLYRPRFAAAIILLIFLYFTYRGAYHPISKPSDHNWTLYLKPLVARQITQEWGQPKQGRTVTGDKLEVRGVPYQNFFGVHAYSEVVFDLGKRFFRFSAKVGLPDYLARGAPHTKSRGSVIFEIAGDGKGLWRSPVMRPGNLPVSVDIDVSDVGALKLVVTDAEDGKRDDHACWIEPTLDSHKLIFPATSAVSSRPLFLTPHGTPWSDGEILKLQQLTGEGIDPGKVRDALKLDRWDFALAADEPKKWKTCAVVGSSQNLLSHTFGQAIDSHDAVFRINNAPTEKYEKFVGSKTTVRFFHRGAYPSVPRGINERQVFVFISWSDFMRISEVLTTHAERSRTLVLSPQIVLEAQDTWLHNTKGWPTTGLLAVRVALSACSTVSIFGFGLDEKGLYGHYYRPTAESPKSFPHDIPREHFILEQLARDGRISRFPLQLTHY